MNQNLHSPTKLTEFARDFEEEPDTLLGRLVNKIQNAYNQSYNSVNDVPSGTQVQVATKSVFYADNKSEGNALAVSGGPEDMSRDSSSSSLNSTKPQTPSGVLLAAQVSHEPSISSTITSSSHSSGGGAAEESSEACEKIEDLPAETSEGRSMLNVLKRMSNMMAARNSDLRNYKDTDLQRFWMPDAKAKECYDCSQKFSTFRRKHHCRLCGQIFCSKCCNQVVPGKIIMCAGTLRVCNYCSKIVLSYLKSPNIAVDLHADLQALQQDLSSKLEDNGDGTSKLHVAPSRGSVARKISLGYQEERFATHPANSLSSDDRKSILQQSNSLIALHEEMQRMLPVQNCGSDLIEYLNTNHKSSNKIQAMAILSAMLAAGFLQPIVPDSEQSEFDENLHYRFVTPTPQTSEALNYGEYHADAPDVLSPQFDARDEPQPPKSIDVSLSFSSSQNIELENSMRSTTTTSKLLESYCDHEEQLLTQMLRSFNLDLAWSKVLTPLCCGAANQFKPEYCTNDLMDVRNYVNFKKVPGGRRAECKIVFGVVFSKNVAHKDMATRVEKPRILLLQCPIVYERIEGKFVSISTVLLQEKEYLRNVCARIMSFKPNVVLVHKNVAGVAQDMLRKQGITLVLDVKMSVMERLARTLQCDIVTSVESNIAQPKLGVCDAFYIQNFSDGGGSSKTLMFFEKFNNPRGFTCLLRGGNNKELAKVKRTASFLVYARYNWRLEMSFLLDEFAQPLAPKPPIFDSKEPSPKSESANLPGTCPDPDAETNLDEPQLRSSVALQANRFSERKSEERVLAAVTENVADFTDPLRSADGHAGKMSPDTSLVELAVETRYDNRFRNALSSTLLSVSPFVSFPLPYLETEQGRKCLLRSLFPSELFFSKLWSSSTASLGNGTERSENAENIPTAGDEIGYNPPHPFLKLKITTPIDNREIQTLLAEFRSYGGRFPKRKKMLKMAKRTNSYQRPQKVSEDHVYKDALDLENHQRLPVLFCSFYFNLKSGSSFCAPPTLLDMKFYRQHDIMLGQFLQRYCCRLNSICTLCNLPMLGHVRRYVHSMGCVQVFLSEDHTKNDPNRIYFTAWCSICNEVTPSVPLSDTTKCLSFAKYLELRFHGHAYRRRPLDEPTDDGSGGGDPALGAPKCEHSLHRDYVHYFTYRGVGAKFQYTPVDVWEIGLPALTVTLLPPKPFDHFQVLEEVKNFSMKGHEIYTRIHERIADLALEDDNSPLVNNLKTDLSKDQFIFKQHIEIVQTLLIEKKANAYDINDAVLMAKRVLADSIDLWGPRLHEMAAAQKLAAKQPPPPAQVPPQMQAHQVDPGTICTEDLHSDGTLNAGDTPRVPPPMATDVEDPQNDDQDQAVASAHTTVEKKSSVDQLLLSSTAPDKKSIKKMLIHLLPSAGPTNPLQSPFSGQEHLSLPLGAFPVLVHDQDLSSIIAYSLTCGDYQRLVAGLSNIGTVGLGGVDSPSAMNPGSATNTSNAGAGVKRKSQESSHESDENNRSADSVNNGASSTTNNNNNNDEEKPKTKTNHSHIDLAFQDNCTQFTCRIYFAKEFDLMRARTLKPPKINRSLYKELEQSKKREELKVSQSRNGGAAEMELVQKPSDAGASATIGGKSDGNGNVKTDEHSQLMGEIEECRNAMARSLSSSVQWEARGGKSGSRFCKTLDDRFVLKEMTKGDITIFENFAPNYFDYIAKCQQKNQPTLLAKIFGVFKVTIKKKDNSFQEKSLLVMENLFYDCDIKNKFDLKGSERNRLVDTTNQHGEIVLLDENLVQMSWSKPLYVLSHSKAVLKEAINRDSSFLEKNEIMDYSLLVGLDNKNGVLVLGIIDYIRTFTFDKRFESFVKQTGLLGGMGKLPTIISPERYKQRFTDAMDRYFYTVPDRWEGLSKI